MLPTIVYTIITLFSILCACASYCIIINWICWLVVSLISTEAWMEDSSVVSCILTWILLGESIIICCSQAQGTQFIYIINLRLVATSIKYKYASRQ